MKLLATTALAVLFALPLAAQQPNCGPRAEVVKHLSEKYGETRQMQGINIKGALIEMWASPETGTWSATLTAPNGITCVVSHGGNFEIVDEELPAMAPNL